MNTTNGKKRKFPVKWAVAGSVVVLVLIAVFVWKKKSDQAPTYREVSVKRGQIDVTILATGTVAPENRLEIKPPIAGRVEQVLSEEGDAVKRGQVLGWMSSTERAALLDAARARGPAELKRWEEFYNATPVLAPIDGTIILKNVQQGQTFAGTDALFVMSDRLTVKAQVDETDIAQVKLKQDAKITLDAYPQKEFPAHVDKIAYDATTVNNVTTYIIDVLPDLPPEVLRSGMTANVNFLVDSKPDVLLIPSEAVKKREGKAIVLVKQGRGKPEERTVTTGLNDGKRTEIVSGLKEGETILIVQFKAAGGQNASPFSPMGRPRGGGR
ncbi:MAG TPA: efflux RND transporter periplasmic adaptor subunit [bacterium]|nr:efflux RND transporter periplasmic adaptor subunit [bacterium]